MLANKKIFPINRERYGEFVSNKVTATRRYVWMLRKSISQLNQPFSEVRTDVDSCIIGNAIPKSGTYLLNQILVSLNQWEDINIHINAASWLQLRDDEDTTTTACLPSFAVRRIQNGQIVAAHIPYYPLTARAINRRTQNRNLKHLFMYRDPRDTMVSYLNFLLTDKSQHNVEHRDLQQAILSHETYDEQLAFIIKRRRDYNYLGYLGWLEDEHCFSLKFEDLFPDLMQLQDGVWGKTVKDLLAYLEVDSSTIDPVAFFKKVYGKGTTASDTNKKIAQYKAVFKDEHYALLDTPKFRQVLKSYGYE